MKTNNKDLNLGKEGISSEIGLLIEFPKEWFPDKEEWERAYKTLLTCKDNIKETELGIYGEFTLFPIEIKLDCGCHYVIERPEELKNIKCKHENYIVKIRETENK